MYSSHLDNFIGKFHQLLRAGFTAHLDLDANAGQAWVGLRVMLGPCHQQQQFHHQSKHRSPSYYCRQERRKAARENAEEATTAAEKNKETEEVAEKKITEENSDIVPEFNVNCAIFLAIEKVD